MVDNRVYVDIEFFFTKYDSQIKILKFGTPYVEHLYTQLGTAHVEHSVHTVWHISCGKLCTHSLTYLMWNTLYTQFGTSHVEHSVHSLAHLMWNTLYT